MRNGMWYPSRKYLHEKGCSMRKGCACGGHNASNAKKSLTHHSTMMKLNRRILRRFIASIRGRV